MHGVDCRNLYIDFHKLILDQSLVLQDVNLLHRLECGSKVRNFQIIYDISRTKTQDSGDGGGALSVALIS